MNKITIIGVSLVAFLLGNLSFYLINELFIDEKEDTSVSVSSDLSSSDEEIPDVFFGEEKPYVYVSKEGVTLNARYDSSKKWTYLIEGELDLSCKTIDIKVVEDSVSLASAKVVLTLSKAVESCADEGIIRDLYSIGTFTASEDALIDLEIVRM